MDLPSFRIHWYLQWFLAFLGFGERSNRKAHFQRQSGSFRPNFSRESPIASVDLDLPLSYFQAEVLSEDANQQLCWSQWPESETVNMYNYGANSPKVKE